MLYNQNNFLHLIWKLEFYFCIHYWNLLLLYLSDNLCSGITLFINLTGATAGSITTLLITFVINCLRKRNHRQNLIVFILKASLKVTDI